MGKLAIIYKKENDKELKFYSITRVAQSKKDNNLIVLDGKFRDKTISYFGILEGNPNYIDNFSDKFKVDKESEDGFYMYVFETEYIKLYAKEEMLENKDATTEIIKKASNIKFCIDESNELTPYALEDPIITEEDVINLLKCPGKPISHSNKKDNITKYVLESQDYTNLLRPIININNLFNINNIDPKSIIEQIKSKIVKQDKVIETLICNIYFNQRLIDSLSCDSESYANELDSRKVGILLDGATGTGKTALAKEIADKFKLPIVIANSNSFSETGYVGATITDILEDLLKKANGDLSLAERGIVFLDEVDKIAKRNEYDQTSMKLGVQKELLGFMSGGVYELDAQVKKPMSPNKISFDTSKLTFILAGAFTDMKEEKIKDCKKSSIGFSNFIDSNANTYTVDTDDYINFGLMREFFARIKVIINMNSYNKEDLRYILFNSSISPLIGLEKTAKMFGAKGISYDDEFIEAVLEKADAMKTNARALQSIMSSVQNKLLYSLIMSEGYLLDYVKLNKSLLDEIEQEKVRKL